MAIFTGEGNLHLLQEQYPRRINPFVTQFLDDLPLRADQDLED